MAQVKEHPILFNAESVRAILEGRKVQTRRVVKPQPPDGGYLEDASVKWGHLGAWYLFVPSQLAEDTGKVHRRVWRGAKHYTQRGGIRCPYGIRGHRLWIREAARVTARVGEVAVLEYQADKSTVNALCIPQSHYSKPTSQERDSFYSGRFMPRWASRIMLEVLDVKVERVQDISEEDAVAEGCNVKAYPVSDGTEIYTLAHPQGTYRGCFAGVWDFINQKRGFGWDANPWCWCILFRRLD